MRLADLPAGAVIMTGSVVTAVEARELREDDLLDVNGTAVTVTGTGHLDFPGMTRVPVSYRPYDNDTVRTERWTVPDTTRFTPRQLLRTDKVTCGLCEPGTNTHDVLIDRVTEGWVQVWVCDAHLCLS
ncbi:hypothetical protein [Streptomyces mutabilis]|uniref:Uncharacterized protein n=1 Tax=Streptomyces mutabilis TaxID=67332 RepID=A0A086MRG4_9ACTN|nr:hypothetical protein [Streptomyces mutabilis]KFG71482.1 hypothetical protein FM21_35080 [Streptomyces mutabilis]